MNFLAIEKGRSLFNNYIDYELETSTRAKPELTIASQKLRASNLIVLVKTNLCSLFLQNYFEKRVISIVFFCEKLGLVALLAATRYLLTNRQRVAQPIRLQHLQQYTSNMCGLQGKIFAEVAYRPSDEEKTGGSILFMHRPNKH